MSAGYQVLSEKEKQTLRLIVRGHDAKSIARHLNLSVHTVNERLRDARRKLEVSSSREAARLVFDAERADPQFLADKQIGAAEGQANVKQSDRSPARLRAAGIIAGVAIMSLLVALLVLSSVSDPASPFSQSAGSSSDTGASIATQESEIVRAARQWLVLHDEGRWKESWEATASSFRRSNTLQQWTDVAQQVRPPLGAVVSRSAIAEESVPAPPAGVTVVKFRTTFANRADVIETVSLVREGTGWKVVGIYLD